MEGKPVEETGAVVPDVKTADENIKDMKLRLIDVEKSVYELAKQFSMHLGETMEDKIESAFSVAPSREDNNLQVFKSRLVELDHRVDRSEVLLQDAKNARNQLIVNYLRNSIERSNAGSEAYHLDRELLHAPGVQADLPRFDKIVLNWVGDFARRMGNNYLPDELVVRLLGFEHEDITPISESLARLKARGDIFVSPAKLA